VNAGNGRRRSFLKRGAGIAATVRFAFAEVKSDRKVRVGVVGGNFGSSFYFHEHPNSNRRSSQRSQAERRDLLMKNYAARNAMNLSRS